MPTDLDDLFSAASPPPGQGPDPDRLWSSGRRRRRWRQAGTAAGGLALVAVVGVGATTLTGQGTPTIDSAAAPPPPQEEVAQEPTTETDALQPERPVLTPSAEDAEETDEGDAADEVAETEPDEEAPAAGPEPDPAAVAAPCASVSAGEMESFIDVVAPVGDQQVTGSVDLVGCARVFEGTVRYRLTGPGGVVVDDHTTASAGGPELGEFRDTLPTGAPGRHTLEVFWEDAADGSERGATTVTFTVG